MSIESNSLADIYRESRAFRCEIVSILFWLFSCKSLVGCNHFGGGL